MLPMSMKHLKTSFANLLEDLGPARRTTSQPNKSWSCSEKQILTIAKLCKVKMDLHCLPVMPNTDPLLHPQLKPHN